MKEVQKIKEFPQEILDYIGEISHIEYPPQGYTSTVVKVESAQGTFVVKQAQGERFSQWLEQEYQVLQVLVGTGLPIAQAHFFLKSEEPGEVMNWLVMDSLPGKSLRSTLREMTDWDTKLDLLRQFGEILRRIHDHPIPHELSGDEKLWVDRMVEKAGFNLHHFSVDGDETLLKRLQEEKPSPVNQKLIHGDYTIDNVMVHENKVIAVIDWGDGILGDPRYDLALATRPKPEVFNQPEELEAFYAGYGASQLSRKEYEYFVDLYEFF